MEMTGVTSRANQMNLLILRLNENNLHHCQEKNQVAKEIKLPTPSCVKNLGCLQWEKPFAESSATTGYFMAL
jgi:hypothetical protein